MTKKQAGSLGGKATVARHGTEHMSKIGRAGAQATWAKYRLQPAGTSGWAMVDRTTGKVKTTIGSFQFNIVAAEHRSPIENDAIPF